MKLSSVYLARSVWLCPFIELNPKGKSLSAAIPILIDMYKFKKAPPPAETLDLSKGIVFEGGEFKNIEGNTVSVNFVVHDFWLQVDVRSSTSDSDNFLTEVLTMMTTKFDLPSYEQIIRKKNYISSLYITMDKSLDLINPKLKELSTYLGEILSSHYEIGGVSLWPDPVLKAEPLRFVFERVAGVPFSENRYFSSAPLQTDQHLELLDKFESILSGS